MKIYFKPQRGFGNQNDWNLSNGNLVSTFIYGKGLFPISGSYPHYSIIGVSRALKEEEGSEYYVWEFDNFHLSVDAKTHYYFREYKDSHFAYQGCNTLAYVNKDLPGVDKSVEIFTRNFLEAKLAVLTNEDYGRKVDPNEYQTFKKAAKSKTQALINNNSEAIVRDWTTAGKWSKYRIVNEAEHQVLSKHYGVDALLYAPADWMNVHGMNKAPEPKPVPSTAKNDSNISLANAKASMLTAPESPKSVPKVEAASASSSPTSSILGKAE